MNTFPKITTLCLLTLLMGAGCVSTKAPSVSAPAASINKDVGINTHTTVCASLYSGRPDDPCWELSTEDTDKLISMVQQASTTSWTHELEPGLGYKGLIAFLPASNSLTGEILTEVSVFNGKTKYNKDASAFTDSYGYFNEPNPHFVYKLDPARNIETWLLSTGRAHMSPETYKTIEDSYSLNTGMYYFTESTYSPTSTTESYDATYNGRVNMEAAPEWRRVETDHLSFELPYSAEWKIEGYNVQPYNSSYEGKILWLDFGKYISGGTYVYREYRLGLSYNKGAMPDELIVPKANDCPDVLDKNGKSHLSPPRKTDIGDRHGVSYLSGGAKGCQTVYHFTAPHISAELHLGYPIGNDDTAHTITPDMQRIIESIRVKK